MRLLRRWYAADVAWAQGKELQPRQLIGFAAPLPLREAAGAHSPGRPTKGRGNNGTNTNGNGTAAPAAEVHDRMGIEAWHRLIALLARTTNRTAVLPLFQCSGGVLDPQRRFGWTVHTSTPSGDASDVHLDDLDELRPAEQRDCGLRAAHVSAPLEQASTRLSRESESPRGHTGTLGRAMD